jgi:hypothetical protein
MNIHSSLEEVQAVLTVPVKDEKGVVAPKEQPIPEAKVVRPDSRNQASASTLMHSHGPNFVAEKKHLNLHLQLHKP